MLHQRKRELEIHVYAHFNPTKTTAKAKTSAQKCILYIQVKYIVVSSYIHNIQPYNCLPKQIHTSDRKINHKL